MECKSHPGQTPDLTCLKCGEPFCRECVKETRESHYCPECHKASIDRLAAQMTGRKDAKPAKVKQPKPPKEPKPSKEDKKLRKPAEVQMPPTVADLTPQPPPPATPAPSLSPQEKAAFWGDDLGGAPAGPPATPPGPPAAAPREPAAAPPQVPPAQPRVSRPAPQKPVEPARVEGLPPPITSVPAGPQGPKVKKPIPTEAEREKAIMTAEGFPTASRDKKKAKIRAVESPEAGAQEQLVPKGRRERRRERKVARDLPVAMQVPEDYDGEVTQDPTYFKAILLALLTGLVGAAAYAALAWLLHRDYALFGWVIGFGVGLVVAWGSGWHFNWKLGLIAAFIAMFSVSLGRIAYFMLDVRFNKILPLKLGIWPLFRESVVMYWNQLPTAWLVFFIMSGVVAFLVAFRPPPVRLQLNQAPRRRVSGKGAKA